MNAIHIHGGIPLQGEVEIQGSKNAVLPILAATLLVKGVCIIQNCPDISDVSNMLKLLKCIGCSVFRDAGEVVIDAAYIKETRLPREYVISMRSSVILMGALLARAGEASLDYPGGCVIGERPIDIHIEALKQLGTEIKSNGTFLMTKTKQLKGTKISLPFPSVGATENSILAATLADGTTVIENSAKEPEIHTLCNFLRQAGAKIEGDGTDKIYIEGVRELNSVVFKVDSDRIVAGTYLFSVLCAGGSVTLLNAPLEYMENVLKTAKRIGAELKVYDKTLCVKRTEIMHGIPLIETQVYPGFPSDLQSMLLVVLSMASQDSVIRENIFNSRFKMAKELNRMGASICIDGRQAYIKGNRTLKGRIVLAEDLRGGAALLLAGLSAQGDTFINNYHYIERGYEDVCKDLKSLGADIRRYSEETEIKEKETKIQN